MLLIDKIRKLKMISEFLFSNVKVEESIDDIEMRENR